jgi:hypothetical protein
LTYWLLLQEAWHHGKELTGEALQCTVFCSIFSVHGSYLF